MFRRSALPALVAALAGTLGVTPAPVAAGSETGAETRCVNEFVLTLTPGLSNQPSQGTFTTDGETGAVTCDGPVQGLQPTGPGRHGEAGAYGVQGPDTCSSGGTGEWTYTTVLPTVDGEVTLTGTVQGVYGPLQGGGLFGGTFTGPGTHGRFTATPMEGDCMTAPITKVKVRCEQFFNPEA